MVETFENSVGIPGVLFFAISLVVVSFIATLLFVNNPRQYFKTKEGQGVLKGILAVVFLSLLFAAGLFYANKANALEYFDYTEVFVGLDATKNVSPMCDTGQNSDRLTSNVGVRTNLVRSNDSQSFINLKYTHHSCAFNPDNRSYDALGLEVTYRFNY